MLYQSMLPNKVTLALQNISLFENKGKQAVGTIEVH